METNRDFLKEASAQHTKRALAMILYGVAGIGKTGTAACYPGIAFLCDNSELGILDLKEAGLVPPSVEVFPPMHNWVDVLSVLEQLRTGEHKHKALCIDALGGFERLMHEHVCQRDFGGEWGDRGFMGYMRGFEVSLAEWRLFLNALDRLRDERNMTIILLAHAKIAPFKNPDGPDYDRWCVDTHQKTWNLTHKYGSLVVFMNHEVVFNQGDETKAKGKAKGGRNRIMYTEHSASWDAKNRYNLPPEIEMGESAQEAFRNLSSAIKAAKGQTK